MKSLRQLLGADQTRANGDGTLMPSRLLTLGLVGISAIVLFLYRPFSQIETGDATIYNYISQAILRGQLPYRDVVDIKSPLSCYLTAAAMWVGKLIGINDIYSGRLLHIAFACALVATLYQVGVIYFRNHRAAFLGALLLLLSDYFTGWTVSGGQPKLPMMLFGMLSLLAVAKERPILSGALGMLSALCWQPGLMFAGVAFLIFSRYLTSWRDGRAIKVAVGALIPLVLFVGYFYLKGGLSYFWACAMEYNYSVFAPEAKHSILDSLGHFWRVVRRVYRLDVIVVYASLGGFALFVVARLKGRFGIRKLISTGDLFRDAILIPPLVYFAFCQINFQSGPDLIPFMPFIALFAGFFAVRVISLLLERFAKSTARLSLDKLLYAGALAIAVLGIGVRCARYRIDAASLQAQRSDAAEIARILGPDGKIYVHGSAEILVLLNRPNLNPYVFIDWGMDDFVASKWHGGSFQNVIDEMESQAPRVVILSRLKAVRHAQDLEQWASEHYERRVVGDYHIFVRSESAPRV